MHFVLNDSTNEVWLDDFNTLMADPENDIDVTKYVNEISL